MFMPPKGANGEVDNIYRSIVDAIPDRCAPSALIIALGMVTSAVLIETAIDKEKRILAAESLTGKIMEAVRAIPEKGRALDEMIERDTATRH